MKVAIYSRKSVFTGKGESIENQIEMCKEYFSRLNRNDVEYSIYEDEGFSEVISIDLDSNNFLKISRRILLTH